MEFNLLWLLVANKPRSIICHKPAETYCSVKIMFLMLKIIHKKASVAISSLRQTSNWKQPAKHYFKLSFKFAYYTTILDNCQEKIFLEV